MRIIEPLRVLIVEDDDATRAGLADAIRSLGHACETASDGIEGWHLHQRSPADVIISAWSIPGMKAAELCRSIRQHDHRHYTHFIATVAQGSRDCLVEGMDVGVDGCLSLPIDHRELELRLMSVSRVVAHERSLLRSNSRLRRDSERNFRAAHADPLTRLSNRLQLDEDLRELRTSPKLKGTHYVIAIGDIDLFKSYNDRYGHLTGDRVLAAIGGLFRDHMRFGDRCYRFGGEEFLVLLRDQTMPGAETAMDRIRRATESLHLTHGGNDIAAVTISVGLAEATAGPDLDVEAWLKRADSALYQAKAEGRNRIVAAPRSPDEDEDSSNLVAS